MDSKTKRRLLLSFISNWVGKSRQHHHPAHPGPCLPPLLERPPLRRVDHRQLHPRLPQLSNIGFGSVAGNEMTMLVVRRRPEAPCASSRAAGGSSPASVGCHRPPRRVLYFLPVAHLLRLNYITESDTKWIIFYLGVSVLLGQLEQLLQSAYRCIGRYPYGSLLKSAFVLVAFAATMIPVILGQGPRITALVFASANILGTILLLPPRPSRHPLDRVRLEPRQLRRDTQARPPCHRLHGLPYRQCAQPQRNCARRRLRPRPG